MLGEYEVELRLHPQVTTTLKVRIEGTTPMPQPAGAPTTEPKAREAAPAKGKEAGPPKTDAKRERPPRKPRVEKKAE